MFCHGENDCPHNVNDNCTSLHTYGECPNGVGKLVERLEDLNRRIHASANPQEVAMLVTEAEMVDRTISDCVLRGDYRERRDKAIDDIFG